MSRVLQEVLEDCVDGDFVKCVANPRMAPHISEGNTYQVRTDNNNTARSKYIQTERFSSNPFGRPWRNTRSILFEKE